MPRSGNVRRRAGRKRVYLEVGGATFTALLAVGTLLSRQWIESLFGVDPDQGSGALEWAIVGGLLGATVALLVLARVAWRRAVAHAT